MQALYALLALALISLLTVNQRDARRHLDARMDRGDVELVMIGVADGLLDGLDALPFHEVGAGTLASIADVHGLTAAGAGAWEAEVETEHGTLPVRAEVEVHHVHVAAGGSVLPAAGVTSYKEVEVRLTGPRDAEVVLTRVLSELG